jgi:hypothetical protein
VRAGSFRDGDLLALEIGDRAQGRSIRNDDRLRILIGRGRNIVEVAPCGLAKIGGVLPAKP